MTTNATTLLDEVLPDFDVGTRYSIRVRATPEQIFKLLQKGIPVGSFSRMLMLLRRLPRIMRKDECSNYSFYQLKQSQDREIVIGIVGQFWKPVARTVEINSLQEFVEFQKEGYSKAALNLRILPQEGGLCLVSTETRVLSYGSAKDAFGKYWKLIRPFSGVIRREVLRKIKRQAENTMRS